MDIQIRVEGVEELIAKLTKLEQLQRVKKQVRAEGTVLRGKMATYPTRVYSPNPLIKSDPRVRRGFFYHLKHGDIRVPYKRTKRLGQSWTSYSSMNGFTVTVENNIPYAPLVQGSEEQVTQHNWSGWLTDKGAMNVYKPQIEARIMAAIEKEVANV